MSEVVENNVVLYDWLTFSAKNKTVDEMLLLLGMQHCQFEECAGRNFYRKGITFHGVSIWYDGIQDNMGVCVNMSGQGCRAFETFGSGDWKVLIDILYYDPFTFNISRLDIAYDDHTGILDIDLLREEMDKDHFVCRSKFKEVVYGTRGTTLYFGSEKSDIMVRIYDKAAERGFDDKHWIRVELQLRRDRAKHFIRHVFEYKYEIGKVFSGVLVGYLCFKDPSTDSNKSRWEIADYWINLLGSLHVIKYWITPKEEYNLGKLCHNIDVMYGNGIYTFISIYGLSGLLNILNSRDRALNDNYLRLLRECPKDQFENASKEISDILDFLKGAEFSE